MCSGVRTGPRRACRAMPVATGGAGDGAPGARVTPEEIRGLLG